MTIRPDLTNRQIEEMREQHGPGSASRYLEERRKEIEAEARRKREREDRERWEQEFVRNGGSKSDAAAAYQAAVNEQAARRAAEVADADRRGVMTNLRNVL